MAICDLARDRDQHGQNAIDLRQQRRPIVPDYVVGAEPVEQPFLILNGAIAAVNDLRIVRDDLIHHLYVALNHGTPELAIHIADLCIPPGPGGGCEEERRQRYRQPPGRPVHGRLRWIRMA